MLETLADYCLRTGAEELLEQWDATRNLPLTPAKLSHGSKQKVWWRCQKGHSWQVSSIPVPALKSAAVPSVLDVSAGSGWSVIKKPR